MGGKGTGNCNGWGCGKGWTGGKGIGWCNGMWGGQNGKHEAQFIAHGTVVSVDTQASTITITMDAASPALLTKLNLALKPDCRSPTAPVPGRAQVRTGPRRAIDR